LLSNNREISSSSTIINRGCSSCGRDNSKCNRHNWTSTKQLQIPTLLKFMNRDLDVSAMLIHSSLLNCRIIPMGFLGEAVHLQLELPRISSHFHAISILREVAQDVSFLYVSSSYPSAKMAGFPPSPGMNVCSRQLGNRTS
jgi:hypothetical protein